MFDVPEKRKTRAAAHVVVVLCCSQLTGLQECCRLMALFAPWRYAGLLNVCVPPPLYAPAPHLNAPTSSVYILDGFLLCTREPHGVPLYTEGNHQCGPFSAPLHHLMTFSEMTRFESLGSSVSHLLGFDHRKSCTPGSSLCSTGRHSQIQAVWQ